MKNPLGVQEALLLRPDKKRTGKPIVLFSNSNTILVHQLNGGVDIFKGVNNKTYWKKRVESGRAIELDPNTGLLLF